MCFKRKKKVITINSRYHKGDVVNFKYRNEICPGIIYDVSISHSGEIVYDIQIGGECPTVIRYIKDQDIFLRK